MTGLEKKLGLSSTVRKDLNGYLFVLPFLIGFFVIFLPCLVESFLYSFNDVKINFGSISKTFVKWKNYYDAFMTDTEFRTILLSAAKGILIDTIIVILFSFFIANVLNQKFAGRGLARTVFFIPVILATGIVKDVEQSNAMYNAMESLEEIGDQVAAFDKVGMAASFNLQRMLTNSGISPSIVGVIIYALQNTYNIANSSGVQILIFLTALQSIPSSLFEASKMEGATKWQEFWKITFPMLTPMIFVNIIYTIIDTFTNPIYGVLDYIQSMAFARGRMGFASALSWIYFFIIIVVLGVVSLIISKRINYLD